MAWATTALIKELGGLDASSDYTVFWDADGTALDTRITSVIAIASARVAQRVGTTVYTTTDPSVQTILAWGESYVALYHLYAPLRARKVLGTHYPLQQEDSERFDALLNTDWLELANSLLEPYETEEIDDKPFAMPAFVLGTYTTQQPDDPGGADAEDIIVEALVDNARSLTLGPPVTP